ncbi:hotdog fold domain-containing protein [Rhodoligotrophos ferricapiens]|uniref:hotdog fold domain-containing protein n=1 Tax=Rhodoligotrophos ferricapiens TaxID=3069264 RepID=UPI00315C7EF0
MTTDLSAYEASIEIRVDSHYSNHVVSLGTIVELFGMAGTKLAYLLDGDGGFMRAMDKVEFLAPAYEGDYLKVTAKLVSVGRTSRKRQYECWCVARTFGIGTEPSHGEVLETPILIAKAEGVTVTPIEFQRTTPVALRADS